MGNDGITLDRLFRAVKVVDMPDGKQIRVRALSDMEVQERNRFALAARYVAEKRLANHDSIEYQATLLPLEDATPDVLRATLLSYQQFDLSNKAAEQHPYRYIPEPDKATDEEKLDTLRQREEQEKTVEANRAVYIKAEIEKYTALLTEKEEGFLRRECTKRTAEFFGREAFSEAYANYEIWMSVEGVDGKRYFSTQAEVSSVPTSVKGKLYGEIREVNSLDPLAFAGKSATDSPPELGS